MNILLVALGSHGDVHPFVGIGLALKKRGHQVTVAANQYFEPLIRGVGLDFAQVGSAEQYKQLAGNPDLWHKTKAVKVVFHEGVYKLMPEMYDIVEKHHRAGGIVAASSLGLAARVAQDKLGVRMATVHLQPAILQSIYDPPVLPTFAMPRWLPLSVKRGMLWLMNRVVDSMLGKLLNDFRAEKGLAPVRNVLSEWLHSPQLTIGLFPDWYAAPQPDWPPQVRVTGFPLYDESDHSAMPEELLKFLDTGDAPVVFTPGSAMWAAEEFFKQSAEACQLLGRRGILLTRHRGHVPKNLPPGVIHVDYAPFSQLLPRAAALVHHGGIGTSAQALASGTPQLITPFTHDQPDNAARLKRLGVAEVLSSRAYRAPKIAAALRRLLDSSDVASSARNIKSRMQGDNSIENTCELIESLNSGTGF